MNKVLTILTALAIAVVPSVLTAQISVRSQLSHDQSSIAGSSYSGSILIRNDTDEIQQAKLYQTDYSFQSDGSNLFGTPGESDRSNASWIDLGTTSMMVPPREAVTISYRVNVPDSTNLEGTFWSIIMVEGIPKSSPESLDNNAKSSLGVVQVTRYAVQVATHIEGTGSAILEIKETAFTKNDKGEATLQLNIGNNGDKMVRPEMWVELYDSSGNSAGRRDGLNNRIYPGTSIQQKIQLGKLKEGTYRALVIMDAGDDEVFAAEFTLNIN
ncbi:MAG: hypothetical protein O3B41_03035 [Bacteroidetes bacterium]|nr:hypothetical protein [Bacteroidota bacterium]